MFIIKLIQRFQITTRTTRTPALWGYPRRLVITHTIDSYWIPSKRTKSKLQIWRICKNFLFLILKPVVHAIHFLKLLDKMDNYAMDPASIVEATEWTQFCPQTDRRIHRRTDGQGETSIPPFQLRWSGGYNKVIFITAVLSPQNGYTKKHTCIIVAGKRTVTNNMGHYGTFYSKRQIVSCIMYNNSFCHMQTYRWIPAYTTGQYEKGTTPWTYQGYSFTFRNEVTCCRL